MSVKMPEPDQAVLARRAEIVARCSAIVPGEGVIAQRARDAPLRVGRADRLPPASLRGGAAGDDRTGVAGAALLPRQRHPRGAARGGDLALGRRAAARRRRAARHGQVQPRARDRFRKPRRRGRARRDQSGDLAGGGARRLLLRARPVLADRLQHRRQHRGELRRRALPEIRHDHQQRARLRDRADHRRGAAHRRQASGQRRLRPARHHHRLGRPARRRHRGDGAHPEKARDGARACWSASRRRRTPGGA